MRSVIILSFLVFSATRVAAQQANNGIKHKFHLGIELNGGAFGLFNVEDADDTNQQFAKADPTWGGTLVAEGKVLKWLYVGGECMVLFAKSVRASEPRLILSPHARVRAEFSVHPKWRIDILAAGGMTIWPENDNESALSPSISATRIGWSTRFAAGTSFLINEKSSLYLNVGYGAFSSSGNDIWVTHDSMLIGLGYRLKLMPTS